MLLQTASGAYSVPARAELGNEGFLPTFGKYNFTLQAGALVF
jgi:hypothetical protein